MLSWVVTTYFVDMDSTHIFTKKHTNIKKIEVSTGVDLNEDLEVNNIQKKLISSLAFSGR